MTDDEEIRPIRRRGLRTGFTTGTCAAAATKAAVLALLSGQVPCTVTVSLPIGREATFSPHRVEQQGESLLCSIIKDAGDDPDVTHGAEICARVWWRESPGLELRGGPGVGTVTRPGLGLEVGGPAINPVPRRMITQVVEEVCGGALGGRGLVVEISVPRGEEIARKTLNARLGILRGISILGTKGIVLPYSTASWRASVEQAIDVAAANGQEHIVLTTGGRSERFAQALLPLPDMAFVEMGIFTGHALKRCAQRAIRRVTLGGMIGKFSKLAQGHFQTHVAGNQVDAVFLAGLAAAEGAPDALVAEMRQANTARHFQELAQAHGLRGVFPCLCRLVVERCSGYVHGRLGVEAIMFDFDGAVLGRAAAAAPGL
ncbi:MAG: cobalt-precorrin-5B (C(1))-methyltransferase [Chloroflexi bacterium]|nr:cobalt-precorrin-5B (C(1))-methyltransferase [Chloroflexota bacterium]